MFTKWLINLSEWIHKTSAESISINYKLLINKRYISGNYHQFYILTSFY